MKNPTLYKRKVRRAIRDTFGISPEEMAVQDEVWQRWCEAISTNTASLMVNHYAGKDIHPGYRARAAAATYAVVDELGRAFRGDTKDVQLSALGHGLTREGGEQMFRFLEQLFDINLWFVDKRLPHLLSDRLEGYRSLIRDVHIEGIMCGVQDVTPMFRLYHDIGTMDFGFGVVEMLTKMEDAPASNIRTIMEKFDAEVRTWLTEGDMDEEHLSTLRGEYISAIKLRLKYGLLRRRHEQLKLLESQLQYMLEHAPEALDSPDMLPTLWTMDEIGCNHSVVAQAVMHLLTHLERQDDSQLVPRSHDTSLEHYCARIARLFPEPWLQESTKRLAKRCEAITAAHNRRCKNDRRRLEALINKMC